MTELGKSLGISFSPHKAEMINRIKEVKTMELGGGGVLRLLSTVMRVMDRLKLWLRIKGRFIRGFNFSLKL